MFYRSSLVAHEHQPDIPDEYAYIQKERQWLLIADGPSRCAFLHIYIACQNSKKNSFIQWNEDLFSLVTCEAIDLRRKGFVVFALGDFNSWIGQVKGLEGNHPDHNRNSPRFLRFIEEVNLMVVNTLPVAKGLFTWFDDYGSRRSSVLDYGLIDRDKTDLVTSFVIDEDARFSCGSDHALLLCNIRFNHRPRVNWHYRDVYAYSINSGTSYEAYKEALSTAIGTMSLIDFASVSAGQMLAHITESIHQAAKSTIGFKIDRKRKKCSRLPKQILALIKERNLLLKQLKDCAVLHVAGDASRQSEIKKALDMKRIEVNEKIMEHRMKKRTKLRRTLLLQDPNRKKFWRLVKGQMTAIGKIIAMTNKDGQMVFKQEKIESVILGHFKDIFDGKQIPECSGDKPEISQEEALSDIGVHRPLESEQRFDPLEFESEVCAPFTYTDLEDMLKNLPSEKATGYDR